MDNESANYYTREVMVILIREFQSPDEEMKKIVLKVCYSHHPCSSVPLALYPGLIAFFAAVEKSMAAKKSCEGRPRYEANIPSPL